MEFSRKYHDQDFPGQYAGKHRESFSRRLNDRREQALLERSLGVVGHPQSVIDVGCGPGRFWPVLAECGATRLCALDVSEAMLRYAKDTNQRLAQRFDTVAGSVTGLPIKDQAFDCVVSMRLLHHFGDTETRRRAILELARIARNHVIVSLWVDGNFKAWRRTRLEQRRDARRYANRHVVARDEIEADFESAGLHTVRHFDLLPRYSQWRYYVLTRVPPGASIPAA